MNFIVLLLALLVERFLHIDTYVFRFSWFQDYLTLMQGVLKKSETFQGAIGLIMVVAPIVIIVAVIYFLLASLLWGMAGFILSLIILIYCLGPRDIYTRFEAYFVAVVREDVEGQQNAVANLMCTVPEKSVDIPRALTQSVFNHFNYAIFTVVFWFLLLGPLAALLYRTIAEVQKYAHIKDSPYHSMLPSATWLIQIIEWIPSRIAALGFALMGDFHLGFSYWMRHVLTPINENFNFIQEAGLASMGITQHLDGTHDVAEIKSAMRLVDRTLVLFVVVVALVVVGGLIS